MVISDLNTKIKQMDEEKQSLVVALRILQEKEISKESGNKKSAFTEVAKNQKQHTPEIPKSMSPSPHNNTKKPQHNNTYDVPAIEDDNESNDDQNLASKSQNTNIEEHGDQERSTVNGQTERDGHQQTDEHTESQPAEKASTANSEYREVNNHRTNETTRQSSLIIGDSMIKRIKPQKLSKSPVSKASFPGKRAEEIIPEINGMQSNLLSSSKVIIHAGTNNLSTDTSKECCDNIENLCKCYPK
ncbi:uncharacterized protein LOC114535252 [Dendronephthya gigantea]|uniref:uncharacterized protein LOC114535252 n=1 Tax=Dendronephthya gigantea TaxID=151771 RepID=UPI00106BDC64|nr:uncharacterized protein LOC114535252 [Dendronephthya gigantea]